MLAVAMVFALFSAAATATASAAAPERSSRLQSVVDAMQPGWNLGNTLDATGPDETSWGNPPVTKELIHQIAKQGYRSIRIPVTWMQHVGPAPDYTVDPAWLDRVQQIVDWSLDEGLYVLINMHHDSWEWVNTLGANHDPVMSEYKAIWSQVADRFKDYPDTLLFESINEPSFSNADTDTQFALLDELNQTFVHLVRDSGGKNKDRPLVLPSLNTNASQANLDSLANTIAELNDPNLIATVHFYGFWPFSVNIAGYTKFEETSINDIQATIDGVYSTFVSKGIPTIIGEYGLLGFDTGLGTVEHGEMLKFFEYFLQYSEAHDVTNMLWDNGQHFNRTTFQWSDPDLFNIIKQSVKGRSSTAETDLIFQQQGAEVRDASVALNLNGNRLVSLSNGKDKLTPGKDYDLQDGLLTIKASYLSRLFTGEPGEKAVLTAAFNKGPDWKFHLRYVSEPQLQDAVGTTDAFTIPTDFAGDQLATMEAVYAAGGYAGPQNWTSYKQFGYAFKPDYANGKIALTPAFFQEVNNGDVVLTFHFWSGKTVSYTITKNGADVVGHSNP